MKRIGKAGPGWVIWKLDDGTYWCFQSPRASGNQQWAWHDDKPVGYGIKWIHTRQIFYRNHKARSMFGRPGRYPVYPPESTDWKCVIASRVVWRDTVPQALRLFERAKTDPESVVARIAL